MPCTFGHGSTPARQTQPCDPLTRNEIAYLFSAATLSARDLSYHLRRSAWRRHYQHRARTFHYRRQATHDP